MSEEMIPEITDVAVEAAETEENTQINYSEKSLAELADLFMELARNPERMKMNKEAEAIKSAFYKNLSKEKAAAGYADAGSANVPDDAQISDEAADAAAEAAVPEIPETAGDNVSENPFAEIERGFKALYNAYRKERAEYNREQEKERELKELKYKQAAQPAPVKKQPDLADARKAAAERVREYNRKHICVKKPQPKVIHSLVMGTKPMQNKAMPLPRLIVGSLLGKKPMLPRIAR